MTRAILIAACLVALIVPTFAATYPVAGRWGESTSSDKGAIDCDNKRVIAFNGETRTDSKGGVPAYRNKTIEPNGSSRWRVVDMFTTGQISNGLMSYTLSQPDPDHLVLAMEKGGTLRLQRCK